MGKIVYGGEAFLRKIILAMLSLTMLVGQAMSTDPVSIYKLKGELLFSPSIKPLDEAEENFCLFEKSA
jgi:hypothetical protein